MAQEHFLHSKEREPHRARTKEILKKHPEIKNLLGKRNPWSFAIILVAITIQISLAWLMQAQPIWLALVMAFLVGTMLNETFIALLHDCSHNALFRRKWYNDIAGLIVNIPMFIPSYISFKKYHMKHHAFQGVYELDADFPSHWEAKFVKNIWYRKLIWLFFYPVIQSFRTSRVKEVRFLDGWTLANMFITLGFNGIVYLNWGVSSLVYMGASFWLTFGLSHFGGRIIQEHFMVEPGQETYSYYGWLNIPALNVGYHNEHHDFPSTPWNNLPKIRKIAPEFYDSLTYHKSWGKLALRFIFSSKISMYDRILRENRGNIQLNAPIKPDLEIAVDELKLDMLER